jgi:anti-sigma regulatory factor (Ser/Thr protein kinase)
VSELATNAIRHARSPFRVCVSRSDRAVCVSVEDLGAGLPREIGQSIDGVSGRGIALVSALAQRWGVVRGDEGKTVWAELALPGSAAARA